MSGCRGEIDPSDDVPRVFVWYVGDQEPEVIEYVEHGIEEEGVSWAVQRGYNGEGVSVAHEAAVNSPLKVGVSVMPDSRIVIHHKQLPSDNPVFNVSEVTAETARKLGSNSARLAKGTPLKPVGGMQSSSD